MTLTRSILLALSAAALTPILQAQKYAAFVFDRSGSMASIRPGSGTTRAEFTETIANFDIAWFFATSPAGSACQVYSYAGSTTTLHGTYFAAGPAQIAAKDTRSGGVLPIPSGTTPLAAALCDATAGLVALAPLALPSDRVFYGYSDGEENSSPSSSCKAGLPDSTGGDHCLQQWPGAIGAFDAGSWQQAVCNVIHAQIETNFYYLGDFADTVGPEEFFRALCDMTGGNLTLIDHDNQIAPRTAWRTSGRGCQDFRGTVLSMTHSGLPQVGETVNIGCRTSNPLPFFLGVGLSKSAIGTTPLPYNLASQGAQGCWLLSSWDVNEGLLPWGGTNSFQVPNTQAFVGLTLYYQAAQLHPLNNALGLATSNLLEMTIAQ